MGKIQHLFARKCPPDLLMAKGVGGSEIISIGTAREMGPEILWDLSKVTHHISTQSGPHQTSFRRLPLLLATIGSPQSLHVGLGFPSERWHCAGSATPEGTRMEYMRLVAVLLRLGHHPRPSFLRPGEPHCLWAHAWHSLQDVKSEAARSEGRSILEPGIPGRPRGACDPENQQAPLYFVCFY